MPLTSQTSISKSPPPKQYTGMDDILIPMPAYAMSIQSEWFPFAVVGTDKNDEIELATNVYVSSSYFELPMTTIALADQWLKTHSNDEAKTKVLTRNELKGEDSIVASIQNDKESFVSAPYTFTLESQGVQYLTGETIRYHDYEDRYRQFFTLLPIAKNQIFTVRAVRRIPYFKTHPSFTGQYEHFLATLKPDAATTQSTLAGSQPLTRRFYTAFFSFEIPIPADADGDNQWLIEHSSKRSERWHLPEGDIVLTYEVLSGYDFLPKDKNAKLKSDAKGLVSKLPVFLKSYEPDDSVPEMRYIEIPFGDFAMYGHFEHDQDEDYAIIEMSTAYKKGKQLMIRFSGAPTLMKKYQDMLLSWLSQIQILN